MICSVKKYKLAIKAVIFDMDGVITNTMPDHFRAWRKVLEKVGIHVTHFEVYSREGQRGISSLKEIFEIKDKRLTPRLARELLARKEALFKKIVHRRFISGARRFLKTLYRGGFQLALVTGTSRHELHRILPDHLFKLFGVVVTGNDVKHGKPHPEPYLLSLKKLKIKSAAAVVIENAPFGIQSAKAAGLKCFALETSLPRKYLHGADRIFASFKDLDNYVQLIKAD